MNLRGLPSQEFLTKPPFISIYTSRNPQLRGEKGLFEKIKKLLEGNFKQAGKKLPFNIEEKDLKPAKSIMVDTLFVSVNSAGEIFTSGFPASLKNDSVYSGNFPKVDELLKNLMYFDEMLICTIERARLKCFRFGIEGLREAGWIEEELPKKVKYGGLLGFEENRIRRHVEHHELMFLEKALIFIKELLSEKKLKTVAIGCRSEFREEVERIFEKLYSDYKILFFESSINDHPDSLTEKVLKQYRDLKMSEKEKLMNSPRMVAVELPMLIELFNSRQLNAVIVNPNSSTVCFYCPEDLIISLQEKECERCSRKLLEYDNVYEILSLTLLLYGKNVYFDGNIEKPLIESAY